MTIDSGPCSTWDVVLPCEISGVDAVTTGNAARAATEILWALSGRQFGECEVEFWPCRQECAPMPVGYSGYYDSDWSTQRIWYTPPCANSCAGACTCTNESRFTLPRPIASIVSITIEGSVVPTGSYEIHGAQTVVRTDGLLWPACNDGSWSVVARFGKAVPTLGLLAGGELTCEFIKMFRNVKECRLPQRVQNVTRQGVTMAFLDPLTFLEKGRVGLYLADLFISAFNPYGLKQPSRIRNPDMPAAVRRR